LVLKKIGSETSSAARIPGPSSAIQRSESIVGKSSIVYASLRGLPCSRLSSSVSSSRRSMITCAVRRM
jgi:hypothetical protein